MWEEHPEYQKQQMRFIGWIVAGFIVYYLAWAAIHHDWDLFRTICIVAGGVILTLSLVVGFIWWLVRVCTRRQMKVTKPEDDHLTTPHE
jgi:bacteriorhodopsin